MTNIDRDPIEVELIPKRIDVEVDKPPMQVNLKRTPVEVDVFKDQLTIEIDRPKIEVELIETTITEGDNTMFDQFLELGEDIDAFSAVCLIANLIYKGTVDNNTRYVVLGILLESGTTGQSKFVRTGGTVDNPAWSWIPNSSRKIYLGLDGFLTQVIPTSGVLIEIGYPLSATSIVLDIEEPILL